MVVKVRDSPSPPVLPGLFSLVPDGERKPRSELVSHPTRQISLSSLELTAKASAHVSHGIVSVGCSKALLGHPKERSAALWK